MYFPPPFQNYIRVEVSQYSYEDSSWFKKLLEIIWKKHPVQDFSNGPYTFGGPPGGLENLWSSLGINLFKWMICPVHSLIGRYCCWLMLIGRCMCRVHYTPNHLGPNSRQFDEIGCAQQNKYRCDIMEKYFHNTGVTDKNSHQMNIKLAVFSQRPK